MHGKGLLLLRSRFPPLQTLNLKPLTTLTKRQPISPSHLLSLLSSFNDTQNLPKARQLHAQLLTNGAQTTTNLLRMYVLCKSIRDALTVFATLDKASTFPWNWMIRAFVVNSQFDYALLFYFKMLGSSALPDKYTFPYVIKSCCALSSVGLGRLVHERICEMSLECDLFIASALIKMYADNDFVEDARYLFDKMPERDCVLWNVMVDGYVRSGDVGNAFGLFRGMLVSESKPNYVTFLCLLSICAARGMLEYGVQFHGLTIKCGVDLSAPVANTLLAMYSKCRCLSEASRLFGLMTQTDLVAWNGMISGYVQNGLKGDALSLFYKMQAAGVKPDAVTLVSLLPAFSGSASLNQGKEIHAYITRNGVNLDEFLKSALIDIYCKSKAVETAQKVFGSTSTIDVVICSAMISGYVLNGLSHDALRIFRQLLKAQLEPNPVLIASVVPACTSLSAFRLGKELHSYVLKNAFEGRCYVESALLDMYGKCGRLDLGRRIFAMMHDKDTVAWNSMIASYTQNGQPDVAIGLFRQMGTEGLKYDCVTISSALSSCASLPALRFGKEIHGFMMRCGLCSDIFAESALIDMYSKCGHMELARCVFDLMPEKNEVSWNSVIAAYGTYGLVSEALSLFEQMQEVGFRPDHITFLALISACGHAGQVEEGFRLFRCMSEEYGIMPRMEHYACMVDLFGRAGQLNEAFHFIRSMPVEPDAGIWGALLGACRVHREIKLAEIASENLFMLDPQNSGYYMLMSNIHAVTGNSDGVKRVRRLMKDRKVERVLGCSCIEINDRSHMFAAGDNSHPDSARVYLFLTSLIFELIEEGYVPRLDLV